jgi:hypothetical protein
VAVPVLLLLLMALALMALALMALLGCAGMLLLPVLGVLSSGLRHSSPASCSQAAAPGAPLTPPLPPTPPPLGSSIKTLVKAGYYQLFALAYGLAGAFARMVMVNSSWT